MCLPLLSVHHLTRRPPPPLSYSQNVIDGDLCEAFSVQPHARQKVLAGDLERPIAEVNKLLEDMRAKI
jgi:hypothetical protein